jgi:AraC-like DNA-binding protein
MVCIRCQMVVKSELEKLGLHYTEVKLGEAQIDEEISPEQFKKLNVALKKTGLELMDNEKSILIEKIKLSDYLSEKLNYSYKYLTNLFSEVQGITIEKFFINHKVERAKELLVYDELNLKEIAYKLHYSSVSHLCRQFKKVTGLTPSHFKHLKKKRRNALEDI